METNAFDFDLPNELIAQSPIEPRDRSRLLVLRRDDRTIEHRGFAELPDLLEESDLLVRNVTKVVPARLLGVREKTGGRWEGLFLRVLEDGAWEILSKTRGKPAEGETIVVGEADQARIALLENRRDGRWVVRVDSNEPAERVLERVGKVPLPPYIRKGRESSGDRATTRPFTLRNRERSPRRRPACISPTTCAIGSSGADRDGRLHLACRTRHVSTDRDRTDRETTSCTPNGPS